MFLRNNTFMVSLIHYLTTAFALGAVGYIHLTTQLTFISSHPNLPFSPIVFWPLLLVIIPVVILVYSSVISIWNQRMASRLAFISVLIGWLYYFMMICPLFLVMALSLLTSALHAIIFVLSIIILAKTTVYTRQFNKLQS